MICKGVIDVQRMFAERRDRAETGRDSDRVKAEATEKHGVVFECCRETHFTKIDTDGSCNDRPDSGSPSGSRET